MMGGPAVNATERMTEDAATQFNDPGHRRASRPDDRYSRPNTLTVL
jgi:hypothetical protein